MEFAGNACCGGKEEVWVGLATTGPGGRGEGRVRGRTGGDEGREGAWSVVKD